MRLDATALLTPAQADIRRRRLEELANEIDTLAANPRAATYQRFELILQQVQELGVSTAREIIIAVASAFMQRPHISPTRPKSP
ncbi:MAG: hypothetical protein ACHQAY_09720 [Hyphomicrobiales bacterium]